MLAHEAYQQAQNLSATRIDILLELYRVALESLEQAQRSMAERRLDDARRYLLKSQTAVMGLAAGLPAYNDELATTFLRLYEYVSRQLVLAHTEGIASAAQVLRTLYEGFLKVRDEASSLELQHKIPPLGHDQLLSVRA
jgi:flagellar biosynthetic protein FliS